MFQQVGDCVSVVAHVDLPLLNLSFSWVTRLLMVWFFSFLALHLPPTAYCISRISVEACVFWSFWIIRYKFGWALLSWLLSLWCHALRLIVVLGSSVEWWFQRSDYVNPLFCHVVVEAGQFCNVFYLVWWYKRKWRCLSCRWLETHKLIHFLLSII